MKQLLKRNRNKMLGCIRKIQCILAQNSQSVLNSEQNGGKGKKILKVVKTTVGGDMTNTGQSTSASSEDEETVGLVKGRKQMLKANHSTFSMLFSPHVLQRKPNFPSLLPYYPLLSKQQVLFCLCSDQPSACLWSSPSVPGTGLVLS